MRFRRAVRLLCQYLGYDIVPYDPAAERLVMARDLWLREYGIRTVIDVGGGIGEFSRRARRALPLARILSFEALPEQFAHLQEQARRNGNHDAFHILLGSTNGVRSFFVSGNPGSSSVLPIGSRHVSAYPGSGVTKTLVLPASRLDDFFALRGLPESKTLLKLDVQGAELDVLMGAPETLKQAEIVLLEATFSELYDGQPLFNAIVAYMETQAFEVLGVENVSQSLTDGAFLQCDVFFRRRGGVRLA